MGGPTGRQPVRCPALWHHYKGAAGPVRNEAMVNLRPDLAIEFPGGTGTTDMHKRLIKARIPLICLTSIHPAGIEALRGAMKEFKCQNVSATT